MSELAGRGPLVPWRGGKIPWNEPGFSQRMLEVHLSQDSDLASRRQSVIDEHVAWIHNRVLGGASSRILDLGCGPGLYAQRFARMGHSVLGVDFSPASIAYACQEADNRGLDLEYRLQDVRQGGFGGGFDLAMMVFGEFNVFSPEEIQMLLAEIDTSLAPGGALLIEASTEEGVRAMAEGSSTWWTALEGLFSAQPHLGLEESAWDEALRCACKRWFILEEGIGCFEEVNLTTQAYSVDGYRRLLTVRFRQVEIEQPFDSPDFLWILARR